MLLLFNKMLINRDSKEKDTLVNKIKNLFAKRSSTIRVKRGEDGKEECNKDKKLLLRVLSSKTQISSCSGPKRPLITKTIFINKEMKTHIA